MDKKKTHGPFPAMTDICLNGRHIFGATHLGRVRTTNEDRYLIKPLDDGSLLLAVADGLGGDVSSDIAAELVKNRLSDVTRLADGSEESELFNIVMELDRLISKKADENPGIDGMATTLVCAVLKKGHIFWINVGDSRLYVLRDKKLVQVTQDQTLAKFLLSEGEITPAQADHHYSSDILDQCIGYGECEPETGLFKLQTGDLVILTTDGLYKMVSPEKLLSLLNQPASIKDKTQTLVNAALVSGGTDNITIVMARVDQTDTP